MNYDLFFLPQNESRSAEQDSSEIAPGSTNAPSNRVFTFWQYFRAQTQKGRQTVNLSAFEVQAV